MASIMILQTMLPLATLVLLQSTLKYTTAQTIPHVTYYWQTTSSTDKVYDYWNHGPIYIPGVHDVFTLTTKARDIFPPWLTKSTTESTKKPEATHKIIDNTTPNQAAQETNASISTTEKETTITNAKQNPEKPTDKPKATNTTKTETKNELATPNEPNNGTIGKLSTEVEDGETEPFSVFLRKFFKALTAKALPELPALVRPVVPYMNDVIKDKKLDWLGEHIIRYLKKLVRNLDEILSASTDILHTKCNQVYNILSNRQTALEKDFNVLLTFMDDVYDEAEEEDMQDILHDIRLFPKVNKTEQDIAKSKVTQPKSAPSYDVFASRWLDVSDVCDECLWLCETNKRRWMHGTTFFCGFVDNLILTPMKRISGTSKGDILVLMLSDITDNRELHLRRYLKSIYRNLDYNDETASYSKNIKNPVLKLGISSLESSVNGTYGKKEPVTYSRDQRKNYKKMEKYKKGLYQTVRSNIEDIQNLVEISSRETNTYELSVDSDGTEETDMIIRNKNIYLQRSKSLSELNEYEKERTDLFDENKIFQKRSYVNHGMIKTDRHKRKKNIMLIPKLGISTKLVKDSVLELSGLKTTLNLTSFSNNDFNGDSKKRITKTIKDNKRPSYPKKDKLEKENLETKYSTNHSQLQSSMVQSKKLDRFNINIRPNHLDINKHLQSTQLYEGKSITYLNRNEPQISKTTTKSSIKASNIRNSYFTQQDMNDKLKHINYDLEKNNGSQDDTLDAEYSSDTGDSYQENHYHKYKTTAPQTQGHLHGRTKSKKPQKHFRNRHHSHRNRHKKRRHKHGHRHSRHGKRKYKNLKRKYQKLKHILAQQGLIYSKKPKENKLHGDFINKYENINAKYHGAPPVSIDYITKKNLRGISDKNNSKMNLSQKHIAAMAAVKGKLGPKNINLFLDDYNGNEEFNSYSQSKIPFTKHGKTTKRTKTTQDYTFIDYGLMFRKALQQNTTTINFNEATEYSDEEKELKKNIYDALRHMDFVKYNESKRSFHHDTTVTLQDPQDTDVEAVLKSNIYKAVKKLLRK